MTERIRQHLHSITLDAAADQVQLPKMNVQPKAAGKSLEAVDRDTLGEVQHLELGVAGATVQLEAIARELHILPNWLHPSRPTQCWLGGRRRRRRRR